MTSSPLPQNDQATKVAEFIAAMEQLLLPIVEKAIIVQVPALGLPIVKQISQMIESELANALTSYIQTGATFLIIDSQIGTEQRAITKAMRELLVAEQSGDQIRIQNAIINYQKAQSALVHDDGSVLLK